MSMLLGPPGSVPIRKYLTGKGYSNSDIGWDQSTSQVTLQGSPLLKALTEINGTSFATQTDIDAALGRRQTDVVNPRNRLMSLLDQLEKMMTQPLNMNFSGNPMYQQAMTAADENSAIAGRNAMEALNARGILNSDQTASTVGQIQQQGRSQASAQIMPTILNAMMQDRQTGMQGLLGAISGYQGVESSDLQTRQLQLQEQSDALSYAIARSNSTGTISEADSQILGVPAGTPTWAAQNAIAERTQALQIADRNLQAQYAQINASTASQKAQALLDVWQFTGTAPAGLEDYGVKAGTPYTETDYGKLQAKMDYENNAKDQADYDKMMAEVPGIQTQFGTDESTAMAIYQVWDNPDRASALADWNSAIGKKEMTDTGANAQTVRKAIDTKWPDEGGKGLQWPPPSPQDAASQLTENPAKKAGLAGLLTIMLGARKFRTPGIPRGR